MDGSTPLEAAGELVRVGPPLGMLAELTHRCPLQCPYCSNPLHLLKAADELDTKTWLSAFSQAADLGVLQVHLSGGEPTRAAGFGGAGQTAQLTRCLYQLDHLGRYC